MLKDKKMYTPLAQQAMLTGASQLRTKINNQLIFAS